MYVHVYVFMHVGPAPILFQTGTTSAVDAVSFGQYMITYRLFLMNVSQYIQCSKFNKSLITKLYVVFSYGDIFVYRFFLMWKSQSYSHPPQPGLRLSCSLPVWEWERGQGP